MNKTTPQQLNLNGVDLDRLYLVSGRESGDDEETVRIVEAPDLGTAEQLFTDCMHEEGLGSEETPVYILQSMPLATAIDQRVRVESPSTEA